MTFDNILTLIKTSGIKLLYGLMVLIIGLVLIHWLMKLVRSRILKSKIDPTLKEFLISIIQIILYCIVILTTINVVGIPLTSVITVVASAGVAVSLAMQGALTNLVGGLTLLVLKPIKAGEYISVNEMDGTVRSIGAYYTSIVTPDNRHISLPNGTLVNAPIINFSREGTRRIDVAFSVSYSSDTEKARLILLDMAAQCGTVMNVPQPMVAVTGLNDSGVTLILRLWCRSSDYLGTLYYLNENGKNALQAAGIEIPFPQMDVHIKETREDL